MALNDLLLELEAREGVSLVTPGTPCEVSADPAPFRVCTFVASDTPENEDTHDEMAADLQKHFAALDAAGNRLRNALGADTKHRLLMLADWQDIPSERWPVLVGHLDGRAAKHAATLPPGSVSCGVCRHFVRDHIGDGTGIGTCRIRAVASEDFRQRPLYPSVLRFCIDFDASVKSRGET